MPTLVEDQRVTPPPPAIPADRGGDGDHGDPGSSFPLSKGQIGTWILLTAVIMLFAVIVSVTRTEFLGANDVPATVAPPLRLNWALPLTLRAVPFVLAASTPVPVFA